MADLPRGRSRSSSPTSKARRRAACESIARIRAILGSHQRLLRQTFQAFEGEEIDIRETPSRCLSAGDGP